MTKKEAKKLRKIVKSFGYNAEIVINIKAAGFQVCIVDNRHNVFLVENYDEFIGLHCMLTMNDIS